MLVFAALALLGAGDTRILSVPSSVQPQPGQPSKTPTSTESPEEITKDAARDLNDSHFYNKPGATRAQYDAAWQECRLIARGTRTPSGGYSVVYNPAVISPAAAAVGGGIGAAIGQAIVEGQQRRANRRACLMIHGWRLVEVPQADRARISAMTDADRSAYFNTIVGKEDLPGMTVTSWHNDFAAPRLAAENN